MDKLKKRKLEILVAILLVFFILLISIGSVFGRKKSDEKEDEVIVEHEPEIDYSKIDIISGKYYYEDEHFSSSFGIDVSEFQDEIDWKKVAEDKVEFAYIRLGRRGATTGLLYEDKNFSR